MHPWPYKNAIPLDSLQTEDITANMFQHLQSFTPECLPQVLNFDQHVQQRAKEEGKQSKMIKNIYI